MRISVFLQNLTYVFGSYLSRLHICRVGEGIAPFGLSYMGKTGLNQKV